jgi:hypothetical protein
VLESLGYPFVESTTILHRWNMIRKVSLIVWVFCTLVSTYAQKTDSCKVIFSLIDARHKEGIPNVRVVTNSQEINGSKYTSSKGKVVFTVLKGSNLNYYCTHPLYDSISGTKKLKAGEDTVYYEIIMVANLVRELRDVVVKPPGRPDTVFQSNRLSVEDFVMLPDGRLVLLTYPKQLRKGSELVIFDGVDITGSFNIPDKALKLVRDYRGNAHVVCENNVYGIQVKSNEILVSNIEKDYFFKYVAPIVDTQSINMYLSNFNPDYPEFHYFVFDQLDSTYRKITQIKDDLMMELYRSEYKWVDIRTKMWAKKKEHETGIDAEIWVGANYFTQSIYYKELYAPLFAKNDTVYVFDYYKDKLVRFNKEGKKLDSTAIYHHYHPKSSGWKKELIQDSKTGNMYAVFDRDGYQYIGWVNPLSGEINEQVRLAFRYAHHIQVHDNFVYYVYRPFESAQKKFLYKERLPYNFGPSEIPLGRETLMETGK